ncbi:DUF2306 domain-containing protein [Roseibaca sp. Y0-43]|uniref:DUF2306 domain-containing protein n=1 Tax=Roseibaca sp. Y0-43 TaxID=2816854 RepID=UPI001D0C772D|nr:DUF2306 domain-containing protein [Roseibaca sp. Y0-43]MCC1482326.1 DUF2306 domain-containing protein [Roseibaca sp. Y0-43]
MTMSAILTASPVIQLHIAAACLAILLGPVALYMRPGQGAHKMIGCLWVASMAVLALSSFGIHGFALIGPFSPLHGLALLTLWSLWEGIRRARMRQVAAHRRVFRNLYWYGLMVAGLFNFLPGRIVNRTLFPQLPELGYVLIALGLTIALSLILYPRLQRSLQGHPTPR